MPNQISDEMLEEWAIIGTRDELVAKVRERCSDIFSTVLLDLAPELRRDEAWVAETVEALHRILERHDILTAEANSMASEEHLLFEVEEGVGIVTLNRPERLNAINWDLATDLVELFRELRHRDEVRVIVLTGAGRAFCSGGDAEWISGGSEERGLPGLSELPLERYQRKTPAGPIGEFTRMIVEVDKPVIAAVTGPVMGAGLAFALACDRRIADTTTRWCAAMVRLGFAPDCGITYFLPRVTRLSTALMMVETGRILKAEEAHREGLIDELVEEGQALPKALEYAKRARQRAERRRRPRAPLHPQVAQLDAG